MADDPEVSPELWPHDEALDAIGLACPLPVLKARRRLAAMADGARLLVAASDPMAAIDIPHLCNQDGHELARQQRVAAAAGERLYFLIVARSRTPEGRRDGPAA